MEEIIIEMPMIMQGIPTELMRIQKMCFANGVYWQTVEGRPVEGKSTILVTGYKFLVLDHEGLFGVNDKTSFVESGYKEIAARLFISNFRFPEKPWNRLYGKTDSYVEYLFISKSVFFFSLEIIQ